MSTTTEIIKRAKSATLKMACLSSEVKNEALLAMADALDAAADDILKANRDDVAAAQGRLSSSMIERLTLDTKRIAGMSAGIRDVVSLPDPVGRIIETVDRPNGLHIKKISVPLGVVGVIYESRPNVTSDTAALCFKSGNCCVLKSGKDAFATSTVIVNVLRDALRRFGLEDAVNILEDNSRAAAAELMTAVGLVDVLIPRGGAGLIRSCIENSRVPCIQTGTGICHIYVDKNADLDMALDIIDNAKTSRTSVCNAEEVCVVHSDIAADFLPRLAKRLIDSKKMAGKTPVELRLDGRAAQIIDGTPASAEDFDTEFLDHILAVAVVDSADDAIRHIAAHSTHHSDGIVTQDAETAELFMNSVDSAAVYVNASTRFTDGGEFGLGCEVGISTQKLHARGPMGLQELTSYKYKVYGNGQIR